MNVPNNETERARNATALGAWENEGGAPGRHSMGHQYGRRIETDRSWTIYHVFTGIPASAQGQTMTGLSRADATSGMLSLNLRNTDRRRERIRLSRPGTNASAAMAVQP